MLNQVRLIDSRGCTVLKLRGELDVVSLNPETVVIRSQTWASISFTTNGRDEDGRPVFRSAKAAIGPESEPYCDLHLPQGWQPPAVRKDS